MAEDGEAEAARLLLIEGVSCYAVEGETSTLICEGDMSVCALESEDASGAPQTIVFVTMDGFTCPLVKNVPVLRMKPLEYVFPLPPARLFRIELPPTVTEEAVEELEEILTENSLFRTRDAHAAEEVEGEINTPGMTDEGASSSSAAGAGQLTRKQKVDQKILVGGTRLASGLESGSKLLSASLVKGAEMLGKGIAKGGEYVKARVKPAEKPKTIDPKLRANLAKTKYATNLAVKVSAGVVAGLRATTLSLASTVASSVAESSYGKKMGIGKESGSGPKATAAKAVAASALSAVGELYVGLETAVKIVASSTAAATTAVVEKKFGADAAAAAKDTLEAVGNIGIAATNLRRIGIKSVIKSTATQTGQKLLKGDFGEEGEAGPSGAGEAAPGSNPFDDVLAEAAGPSGVQPLTAAPVVAPSSSSPAPEPHLPSAAPASAHLPA